MRSITIFLLLLLPAIAQEPQDDDTGVIFSSNSQLVVETVSVRDKAGRSVEGLKAPDFKISENGMPQTISFVEYQKLPENDALPPVTGTAVPLRRYPNGGIAPESSGNSRYRDHRLLVLYFDMTAMPPADQLRSIEAARKFIRTQMTPSDLVAVMMFSGGAVKVLQDFTSDRDRLATIIETLAVGEAQGFDEAADDDSAADTGDAFGQDSGEFNIFNTDRQLAALQTAAGMLGGLSEKKSLLYFASGINLNRTDNQAQLHATVNAAIRAGVSLWPIDSRGLVAAAPQGDASRGSSGGAGMYSGSSSAAVSGNLQSSQDTLFALAADTGGQASLDSNDLGLGIVKARNAVSSYYIVGYYTTNQTPDGAFRRIKISLNNGLSAALDFRQGYFATKQFSKFTAADKERQLEEALMLEDPITELDIATEVDYFQMNQAEYFVPVSVRIPGREMALAKKGGEERAVIDFIGEVKDEFGSTVQNVRDKAEIRLSDRTAEELTRQPIQYGTGFTLLPGKYTIKLLARDSGTGKIGTYQSTFVVPNLNKEGKYLPISSVVLSSQRVDVQNAGLKLSKHKSGNDGSNPLVTGSGKLIPNVTRVFSSSHDIYIYLQAYQRSAAATQPVVAFVTFFRGKEKAFETAPVTIQGGLNAKSKAMPLSFDVPLEKLAAGEYTCQVSVLDLAGSQKAAFWQTQVKVVP